MVPAGYWLGIHASYGPVGLLLGTVAGVTTATVALGWRFLYITSRPLHHA